MSTIDSSSKLPLAQTHDYNIKPLKEKKLEGKDQDTDKKMAVFSRQGVLTTVGGGQKVFVTVFVSSKEIKDALDKKPELNASDKKNQKLIKEILFTEKVNSIMQVAEVAIPRGFTKIEESRDQQLTLTGNLTQKWEGTREHFFAFVQNTANVGTRALGTQQQQQTEPPEGEQTQAQAQAPAQLPTSSPAPAPSPAAPASSPAPTPAAPANAPTRAHIPQPPIPSPSQHQQSAHQQSAPTSAPIPPSVPSPAPAPTTASAPVAAREQQRPSSPAPETSPSPINNILNQPATSADLLPRSPARLPASRTNSSTTDSPTTAWVISSSPGTSLSKVGKKIIQGIISRIKKPQSQSPVSTRTLSPELKQDMPTAPLVQSNTSTPRRSPAPLPPPPLQLTTPPSFAAPPTQNVNIATQTTQTTESSSTKRPLPSLDKTLAELTRTTEQIASIKLHPDEDALKLMRNLFAQSKTVMQMARQNPQLAAENDALKTAYVEMDNAIQTLQGQESKKGDQNTMFDQGHEDEESRTMFEILSHDTVATAITQYQEALRQLKLKLDELPPPPPPRLASTT